MFLNESVYRWVGASVWSQKHISFSLLRKRKTLQITVRIRYQLSSSWPVQCRSGRGGCKECPPLVQINPAFLLGRAEGSSLGFRLGEITDYGRCNMYWMITSGNHCNSSWSTHCHDVQWRVHRKVQSWAGVGRSSWGHSCVFNSLGSLLVIVTSSRTSALEATSPIDVEDRSHSWWC